MAKTQRVECSPQTRRNHSDKKKIHGREEARSINLTCGRNFYNEIYVYKFDKDESERDHLYPWTFDNDFIFPEADSKDGITKIFDSWAALTKEQIGCTCPFYDVEKGCLKALELGVKHLKKKITERVSHKKINKVEKQKETRACLYTIKNLKETFEESLKDYILELKEEVENPEDFIEKEVPFLYEAFLFKSSNKPLDVKVPKTLDELEASLHSSVKDFNSNLSGKEQKDEIIKELMRRKEEEDKVKEKDITILKEVVESKNSDVVVKRKNRFDDDDEVFESKEKEITEEFKNNSLENSVKEENPKEQIVKRKNRFDNDDEAFEF